MAQAHAPAGKTTRRQAGAVLFCAIRFGSRDRRFSFFPSPVVHDWEGETTPNLFFSFFPCRPSPRQRMAARPTSLSPLKRLKGKKKRKEGQHGTVPQPSNGWARKKRKTPRLWPIYGRVALAPADIQHCPRGPLPSGSDRHLAL